MHIFYFTKIHYRVGKYVQNPAEAGFFEFLIIRPTFSYRKKLLPNGLGCVRQEYAVSSYQIHLFKPGLTKFFHSRCY